MQMIYVAVYIIIPYRSIVIAADIGSSIHHNVIQKHCECRWFTELYTSYCHTEVLRCHIRQNPELQTQHTNDSGHPKEPPEEVIKLQLGFYRKH